MRSNARRMLVLAVLSIPLLAAGGSDPVPVQSTPSQGQPAQSGPSSGAPGRCSMIGTWVGSNPYATLTITFGQGGTGTWDVRNRNGDNGGAMSYSFDGTTANFTNTSVTHQEDPRFFPCLNIPATYRVSFSPDCRSIDFTAVSDACPVRHPGRLTRQ